MKTFVLALLALFVTNASIAQNLKEEVQKVFSTENNMDSLSAALTDHAFLIYLSQPDSAIFYAEKAIQLARDKQDNTQLGAAYNVLGLSYEAKGFYSQSLNNFFESLKYMHRKRSAKDIGVLQHNISLVYRKTKNYKDALQYELLSLKAFENLRDTFSTGASYHSLGVLYKDMKDFAEAEEYILKAIAIFSNAADGKLDKAKNILANAYSTYGNLLVEQNRAGEAIKQIKTALAIHKNLGYTSNISMDYENLGDAYFAEKDFISAKESYEKAMLLWKQIGSQTDVGYELMKLAGVDSKLRDYSSSISKLHAALDIMNRNNAAAYREEIYMALYETYELKGEVAKALQYYKKAVTLKDSLHTEAQQSELLRLKTAFQTTQKEQKIALLQAENTVKKSEALQQLLYRNIGLGIFATAILIGFLMLNRYRIKQKLKEVEIRNRIASDLHDDVGSTLSSIRMYSDIVSNQVKETHPASKELLSKISNNSKEMIENMSDIVWMIKPGNDDVENIENRMLNFANELCVPAGINFEFNKDKSADEIKLTMKQRRDLYLIFKEAINNAVKYAGCHSIHLAIMRRNNCLEMTISDDGKGFSIASAHSGNGLANMKKRAEINSGDCIIKSSAGGTEIKILFPI